jgi:SWIM zinc finger
VRLARQGRCMYDVEAQRYRHRELFETPADEATYFPPDRRRELAAALINENKVRVVSAQAEETKKVRSFKDPTTGDGKSKIVREITYRDWRVIGAAGDQEPVEIVVNDLGSIIFGRCTCPHFAEHLLSRGPCEHMLALFKASEALRTDRPSSAPVEAAPAAAPRKQPSRWEVDGEPGETPE